MHQADTIHAVASLQDKLERIFTMRKGDRVQWDQAAFLRLLESLGRPHYHLPPILHVAGTNGKGSIVALLRSILEAAGYKVHAYTSPHLLRVNERIYLSGTEISDSYLEHLLDEVLDKAGDDVLSFFEVITGVAFKAFSDVPADVLLLEVGMGGRLDCTNVVPEKLVSVISRISLDHTDYLGTRVEDIAREKAGIMMKDVPAVVGCQGEAGKSIVQVLREIAAGKGAPILVCGDDWDVKASGRDDILFSYQGEDFTYPRPILAGVHQVYNAGAALAALSSVAEILPVSEKSIRKGLSQVFWPGRLQRIKAGALGLPEGSELWLDCGHNDSAGEVLAEQVKLWHEADGKSLSLVVGMLGSKDARSFLEPLLRHVDSVHLVGIEGEQSCFSPEALRDLVHLYMGNIAVPVNIHDNLKEALGIIAQDSDKPQRILVAGSVYLAGDFMRLLP